MNNMLLTGKCEIAFSEWLVKNKSATIEILGTTFNFSTIGSFSYLPFSMMWGIYEDFFESVNINVFITPCHNADEEIETYTYYFVPDFDDESPDFKTKIEAKKDAINMCNEIFNSATTKDNHDF